MQRWENIKSLRKSRIIQACEDGMIMLSFTEKISARLYKKGNAPWQNKQATPTRSPDAIWTPF